MLSNFIITFLLSIFGFQSVIRSLYQFLSSKLRAEKAKTIFVIAISLLLLVTVYFTTIFLLFIYFGSLVTESKLWNAWKFRNTQRKFVREIPHFLDMSILVMRSGASVRQALVFGFESSQIPIPDLSVNNVTHFQRRGEKLQVNNEDVILLVENLVIVLQSPHIALNSLVELREHFQRINDCRRKSKVLLRGSKIQSGFMVGIYLLLAAFVISHFPFERVAGYLGSSFVLFLIGTVGVFKDPKIL